MLMMVAVKEEEENSNSIGAPTKSLFLLKLYAWVLGLYEVRSLRSRYVS